MPRRFVSRVDAPCCCHVTQRCQERRFLLWYEVTLRQECARRGWAREPYWTEAAAVGGRQWIAALASQLPVSWRTVELIPSNATAGTVAEAAGTYVLHLSTRKREEMLDLLGM